jgi:hypothetical protein
MSDAVYKIYSIIDEWNQNNHDPASLIVMPSSATFGMRSPRFKEVIILLRDNEKNIVLSLLLDSYEHNRFWSVGICRGLTYEYIVYYSGEPELFNHLIQMIEHHYGKPFWTIVEGS